MSVLKSRWQAEALEAAAGLLDWAASTAESPSDARVIEMDAEFVRDMAKAKRKEAQ